MGREILLETGSNEYPNHVYVLTDGMLSAYWQRRNKLLTVLPKPILFSRKNRAFRALTAKEAESIESIVSNLSKGTV
jgi:hypothetical protein